jgi:hypothetical protein
MPNFALNAAPIFSEVDRGVPHHLAFSFRGLDQLRRDGLGRRRLGKNARGEHGSERECGRAL